MWIQNYLSGITEVGQESSFDWSPAGEMNSSPLEKQAALAAAAEGTLQEGCSSACLGHRGGEDSARGWRQQQRRGRRSCICESFPCDKYLAYMISSGSEEG